MIFLNALLKSAFKQKMLTLALLTGAFYSAQSSALTVSASSDDGNVAKNTIDGRLSSRWSALGDGAWISYDLGQLKTLNQIAIGFFKGNTRTAYFDIEVSEDNQNFSRIWSGSQPEKTTALQSILIDAVDARWVRIVGRGNSSNSWNSITEVKLTTTDIHPDDGITGTEGGMAKPVSVSASGDDGNKPENTLDSRLNTRWSAKGDGAWIQYDLGKRQNLDAVAVAFFKGEQRKAKIEIQVSIDNKNFISVWSGLQPKSTNTLQRIDINDSDARWVRIIGFGNTSNAWNSISEVSLLLSAGQPGPSEPGSGNPGSSNPGQGHPGEGNNSELDANKAPSENFDLSAWYISVPTDGDNNGKADSIKERDLNKGFEDPTFFYTAADGGMVFRCPNKGYKTSKNTRYTRTELREMLRKGDTAVSTQGVNPNNWVFAGAPASDRAKAGGIGGRLSATLSVNHVTTTGSKSQVGRVIIGQIHANDDEPLRLYYRKLPGNTLGSVYFAHEPLGKKDHYVELIGSRSSSAENLSDGIALNEKFSYDVVVADNILTVTIKRQGKKDIAKSIDMTNSGYNKGGQYMYFKAGVYNQNNTGDDDDYVQATFYALSNAH